MTNGTRKIASGFDAKGNEVVQFLAAPNALSQDSDIVSQGLYLLTEEIVRGLMAAERGGGLGGEFGYGVPFENDVFVMRRQYWGDCDCGADDRESKWMAANEHADTCYQADLRRARIATGMWEIRDESWQEWWKPGVNYDKRESKIFDELCAKHGLDREHGAAVHCTCDYEQNYQKFLADGGGHAPTCSLELPNFLHKRTGLEIRWYKWIGRSMEANPKTIVGWGDIFRECWESIPKDAHERAAAQRAHEETPEYKAKEAEAIRAMMAEMDKMFAEGVADGEPPF